MIVLALLLALQSDPPWEIARRAKEHAVVPAQEHNLWGDPIDARNWWEKYPVEHDARIPQRLGTGPHTLVVSDGNTMTRMEYRTGSACQRARDSVNRQVAPPAYTGGAIYGPPSVKAFCVPR